MKQKHLRLTARRREGLIGLFFLAPFLIGTLLCFAFPTISSFLLSFGATDTQTAGFHIQMTGLENYSRAFFKDTNFVPYLLDSIQDMLIKTPLILVFSLLIAILLSKVRHFKGFFRVVALLPFLLGNGQVLRQMMREGIDTQILSLTGSSLIPQDMLAYIGQDFLGVIDSLFSIIVTVLWSCGVQILLFLAAIQSISPALYESAHIDGASTFTVFWKIVMPNVKPAWLTLAIFSFQGLWNNANTTYIYREELKSLPYALNQIVGGGIIRAGAGAAVSVIILMVPLLLFIFTQSRIIETMSTSGMKE